MERNKLEQLLFKSIEENTPESIKEDRVFDYNNKDEFTFTLTKELVQKLDLWSWFKSYKKEAMVSTAGIRGPQNILYPHDTRFPINTIGVTLATLGKALALKDKYQGKKLLKLCGCEVRYNSKIYMDIITRIQAKQGITTIIPKDKETMPIWLASFLAFKYDLVGAEYITSSHGISVKNATKDLNEQGSQFLPSESMAFVDKIEEILNTVEKEGAYKIEFSARDDSKINEEVLTRLNKGVDLYIEYLKEGVAKDLEEIKNFNKKIIIDNVGGCSYKTTSKILEKLNIEDKFVWFNIEEDPFFHGIGKYAYDNKEGEKYLYDWSLDVTVLAKDKEGKNYFPVVESMNYSEKLKDYPTGTVSLITDPDHDRLTIVQKDSIKNLDKIKKNGIDYSILDDKSVLCIYSANQAFLMIMNYWAKHNNITDNHKKFIIKTSASSKSWDEWAKNNNIECINTPVGFKEIANICKKIEAQMLNGVKNIAVYDVFGNRVELGSSPRLLFAGEESGGMIVGASEPIKSHMGRIALAMREKSASEAIILSSNLIASLKDKTLCEHLEDIYNTNNITARFDTRQDISYYNESEMNIEKLKRDKIEGEAKRTKNDTFYLALALGISDNKITLDNAKEILSSTFKDLNFDNLTEITFCGDGTYMNFTDKFVEIRPSGTDAKTKAYAGGADREELTEYGVILGNYEGDKNQTYLKYLDEDYCKNIKENSLVLYREYTDKDSNNTVFAPQDYSRLLK